MRSDSQGNCKNISKLFLERNLKNGYILKHLCQWILMV